MADGSFPILVSKDRDSNAVANPIFVQLSDGTDSALISAGGALSVILAANSGVDIGDVTVNNASGASAVNIQDGGNSITVDGAVSIDDGGGSITVDGTVSVASDKVDDSAFSVAVGSVSVISGLADETAPDSVDEGDVGALRMTLDRKLLTRIVGASDANRLDIDASGHGQIDLAAVSVTAVPVSKNSSANADTNPLFVQVVSGVVSGVEKHSYDTTASVAADASDNHDYTVTATKTFLLKSVIFAASGGMKVEIQAGPILSLVTIAVGFLNGRGGGQGQIFLDPPYEVPDTGTGTIRVIRSNRQGSSQDVYSTIVGTEI